MTSSTTVPPTTVPPTTAPRIRVLIADDSLVMREVLRRMVESAPTLEVCGTARDGEETLAKVHELDPNVVTLDVEMPLLNGIEVLKRIMRDSPRPVIMISSHTQHGAEVTLEGLSIGAFDYLPKSENGRSPDPRKFRRELIAKIEAAAARGRIQDGDAPMQLLPPIVPKNREEGHSVPAIIALGTSTGGPKALEEILPELPPDLPVGMIVVQHMPPGFTGPLAQRLNMLSAIKVCEAQHGDVVQPATVYIAPAGKHLTVAREPGRKTVLILSDEPPDTLHRPSVDVMMLSVAEAFGRCSLGIILTGMGSDGLLGMTAIRRAGGITLGQDEATSTVYGMPRACAENGILEKILSLEEIPEGILQALQYRPKHGLTPAVRPSHLMEYSGKRL